MAGRGGGTRRQIDFRKIAPTELQYEEPSGKLKYSQSIGAGGFGYVRKAVWNNQGRKMYVAVKCFFADKADVKHGFVEELRGLTLLQSDNMHIVQLLGAHNCADPYIVMEYAPLSLEKVLHDRLKGKSGYMYDYKSDHVISWSHQLALGLDYIHSKKILHRDIKPSNLLLFDNGKLLKLCDFGTARKLDLSLRVYTSGGYTSGVGTARYMAPEVITGNNYNEACDVFSFGIAVWEMLARRRPVIGKVNIDLAILYATAKGARPQKLAGLPTVISDMIELCWEEPPLRPKMNEISQKLQYLCRYVDTALSIKEMSRVAKTTPPSFLHRPVSVTYSKGDHLEPPHADVQYDSLQEDKEGDFYVSDSPH